MAYMKAYHPRNNSFIITYSVQFAITALSKVEDTVFI